MYYKSSYIFVVSIHSYDRVVITAILKNILLKSWMSQLSRCLLEDREGIEPAVHSTTRIVRCSVQGQCCNVMPARVRACAPCRRGCVTVESWMWHLSLSPPPPSPREFHFVCDNSLRVFFGIETSEDCNSLRRFIIFICNNRRGQKEFTQFFVRSELVRMLLLRFPIQHLYKT